MSVASPSPPRTPQAADPSALEALIKEARRRARRRRALYAIAAVLLVGAGVAGYFGTRAPGGARTTRASAHPPSGANYRALRSPRNGAITLMDLPTNARAEAPRGWYGVSTVQPDGTLVPLVRCPGHADWCGESENVAWAPDGRRLALTVTSFALANRYNGTHVIDVSTGRDRQLRCGLAVCDWRDLAWSPDGKRLAFTWGGSLYIANDDGSDRRAVHTGSEGHDSWPSWSPSGRWITYSSTFRHHPSVYVVNLDGTGKRLVARRGSAPAWSPLGTAIAYRYGCGIRLATSFGRDVTPPSPFKCNAIGISGPPAWSPDGRKLAMSGTTKVGTGAVTRGTFVMNADGTKLVRVTRKTSGIVIGEPPRPAWRPVP
jgi:hypothetical protein